MKICVKNRIFAGYENDVRALLNSFYPGAELRAEPEDRPTAGAAAEKNAGPAPELTAPEEGCQDDLTVDLDSLSERVERSSIRFEEKTNLKRELYQLLSGMSGRELPWGTLTGIRPVRIVEMLEAKGLSEAEVLRELKERFLISDEKIRLVTEIAAREKQLLSGLDYKNGCSIYIGIPFCPTRCLYCSFTSNPISAWEGRSDEYIDCLLHEMQMLTEGRWDLMPAATSGAASPGAAKSGTTKSGAAASSKKTSGAAASSEIAFRKEDLRTIYVGGGTPTALGWRQLDRLLEGTEKILGISAGALAEFTVEAGRPDSITREKLEVLKSHGISRISVNPQTFNQKTLDLIGRKHTTEQTVEAYLLARRLGFDNINMDLIMGLPGEDLKDVRVTLEKIRELKPDSLTVHTLAVKRASRLSAEGRAWGEVGRIGSRPDSDRAGEDASQLAQMTALGAACAAELGMNPYYIYRQKNMAGNQDNVGYALPGKECLYNILMMEEKHSVFGLGAGSSSKIVTYTDGNRKVMRLNNNKNIEDYMLHKSENKM